MSPAEIKTRVWRLIDQLWNRGDLTASAQALAPVVTMHFNGNTQLLTVAQMNTIVSYWREAYPDFHFTLGDIAAEGDRTTLHLTFTGTSCGEGFGAEAPGQRVVMNERLTCRLKGDKIVEMWEEYEEPAVKQQFGFVPLPLTVG